MDRRGGLASLWAKTNAGGKPHSLLGHLLDTAAVAELLWDEWLPAPAKRDLNAVSEGRGRDLLVLLGGWHDLGKATPAFQVKAVKAGHPELIEPLAEAGLGFPEHWYGARDRWPLPSRSSELWPHGRASAVILLAAADQLGWSGWEWAASLIEGHHGYFGKVSRVVPRDQQSSHGGSRWAEFQLQLADEMRSRVGLPDAHWVLTAPSRGVQLALAGVVVMADWIASSDLFPGVGLADQSWNQSRDRARQAWQRLGLIRGWSKPLCIDDARQFERRFGFAPRPLQAIILNALKNMDGPGLVIVEAPMGEGKTEAALAGAELLSASQGQSGLVFAMPTQGTTDAMYHRLVPWLSSIDPSVPLSLLHGKAMLNQEWVKALEGVRVGEVHGADEYGMDEDFAPTSESGRPASASVAPSSWLMGRHRGLLSPAAVATIDQVLWAATRTKFVSLRHAGLWGKVLVIDEVHSYDAYMGVFLHELLRWCARLKVAVILMSATLPPSIRSDLVDAWAQGAGVPIAVPPVEGYPSVMTVQGQSASVFVTEPYREDLPVRVTVLPVDDVEDTEPIARAVADELINGGRALVILNTVRRAQEVYQQLKAGGVDSLLIHGRLTAAQRAQRTETALQRLGPGGNRAGSFVVVATQIAEQSFDADADILFTDVAPIDLLLQRIGRLHRHDNVRPEKLREPQVFVTGLRWVNNQPSWARAFAVNPSDQSDVPNAAKAVRTVYRPRALLATAAELTDPVVWAIPSQVPALVATGYDDDWHGPRDWEALWQRAREHDEVERRLREAHADTYRLDADPGDDQLDRPGATLANLHAGASRIGEGGSRPVVRDGDDGLEVCLIMADERGLRTLGGTFLGRAGERATNTEVAREVLGDSVRLRWRDDLAGLGPFPAWAGLSLFAQMPVVVLDTNGWGMAGTRKVHYDSELGLTER